MPNIKEKQLKKPQPNVHKVIFDKRGNTTIFKSDLIPSKASEWDWLYVENNSVNTYTTETDPGKWMIFVQNNNVDQVWQKVILGVEQGLVWQAKVAPPKPDYDNQVIIVYTPFCGSIDDVIPTYKALVDLGAISATDFIKYKSDKQTLRSEYEDDAYLYTSDDAKKKIFSEITREIDQYLEQRTNEHDITLFGKQYLTFFGPWFGYDKDTKINAATKLKNLLAGIDIVPFTKEEQKALKNARLGQLVERYTHYIPASVWDEPMVQTNTKSIK